ncbi:hypothetical protein Ahy_B05g079672 [Arachis hypogaea]|uniref:Aminotransferase-like plant mobile domain-containing protein n=1 Tax=Arachis hypogaea TaxID=3818 RepID=A0A444ZAR1_ARAHY|nr:hypothetical protein Ahy_B05g079672 [Arachis hypogaea]
MVFDLDRCIFARSRLLLPRKVSHTLPPSNAIVSYLREAGFDDTLPLRDFVFDNSLITAMGECTITLQDVAYHLGLRAHREPVGGCFSDFHTWYGTEAWELVERLLGAKPFAIQQQGAHRKEFFSLKLA